MGEEVREAARHLEHVAAGVQQHPGARGRHVPEADAATELAARQLKPPLPMLAYAELIGAETPVQWAAARPDRRPGRIRRTALALAPA